MDFATVVPPYVAKPLELLPFRAVMLAPARVGDPASARALARPYREVAARLTQWIERGLATADTAPALYLHEYTSGGLTVRGLVGALRVSDRAHTLADRAVWPHEAIHPEQAGDLADRMLQMELNPAPILLVHHGRQSLRDLLAEVARTEPEWRYLDRTGQRQRIWAIRDEDVLTTITGLLADTGCLLADGHHRYAAYLRLQEEMRDPDAPPGTSPWDHGLAMLVDEEDAPLRVGPIHRSIAALTLSDLQDLADDHDHELTTCADRESAFAALTSADPKIASFVVSDGLSWAVLRVPRTNEVDAAVLHERLMPDWRIAEEQVGYHHSLDQALRATIRAVGLVVALRPPTVAEVRGTAARGERMPRKSTSFGPKPRMGVVMRDLRDG